MRWSAASRKRREERWDANYIASARITLIVAVIVAIMWALGIDVARCLQNKSWIERCSSSSSYKGIEV